MLGVLGVSALAAAGVGYALYKYNQLDAETKKKSNGTSCCEKKAQNEEKSKEVEDGLKSLPIFDLQNYLEASAASGREAEYAETCKAIAEQLHKYGILIVKDPRVSEADNDKFINMLEKYFEQPRAVKMPDSRPQVHYQVGVTPDLVEKARDHCALAKSLPDRPMTECPPGADPKWRFFWRMGEQPKATKFPSLNASQVIPSAFPEWPDTMNMWGSKMLSAVHTVAEMAALGLGLNKDSFTSMMQYGPHLLAPTGSDLSVHGKQGTVFASFHYDLNFMTIHGRSRFPGLYVWTREGKKILVKVPANCLLLQAGKQFEWLTGGHVLAGFHEVVVVPETLAAIQKAKQENRSLWRISSTLFSHIASDNNLCPLPKFATKEALEKYPMILAGDQVQNELKAINLAKGQVAGF